MKKWSWSEDDELWILWHLDIVGVDHVVIAVDGAEIEHTETKSPLDCFHRGGLRRQGTVYLWLFIHGFTIVRSSY